MDSYPNLYLEDVLDDDQNDIQSLYSKSDNENENQDYYSQHLSFSYPESKISPMPISKIKPNLLNLKSKFQSKSLSYPSKDDSEYKELFNEDFFAKHNEYKRQ